MYQQHVNCFVNNRNCPRVSFLLTVPGWCFFCGSYLLCHTAMSISRSLVGKGLTSWLSCMWCFLVVLSLSHTVSFVRCGTWLYRFLIFAFFLTLCLLKLLKVMQPRYHTVIVKLTIHWVFENDIYAYSMKRSCFHMKMHAYLSNQGVILHRNLLLANLSKFVLSKMVPEHTHAQVSWLHIGMHVRSLPNFLFNFASKPENHN